MSSARILESSQGAYVTVNGKKYLNLCSNNYLGLASDERLKNAAIEAIKKYGVGTTSVRPLIGTNDLHLELERRLAEFKKTEAALVLTGGYITNLAVMQTLLTKEDIVISDEYNHASIIDAIRLSQVQHKFIYKHNDTANLRSLTPEILELKKSKRADGKERVTVLITDGVFSMDGDIANIPLLSAIANEIGAMLVVDDAHGEGVLGKNGRGIVDYFGAHGQVDIEVGTLSKAFGVMGGFIAGDKEVVDIFRSSARQYMFTNALSIPDTAALIEAVKIMEESDERVVRLWENSRILKQGLTRAGFDIGISETPITPVMIGDETKAKEFAAKLFDEGIFVSAIVFPMVPQGKARLRLIPSSLHTSEDVNHAINTITRVGKEYLKG